jgi:hypothetical protein
MAPQRRPLSPQRSEDRAKTLQSQWRSGRRVDNIRGWLVSDGLPRNGGSAHGQEPDDGHGYPCGGSPTERLHPGRASVGRHRWRRGVTQPRPRRFKQSLSGQPRQRSTAVTDRFPVKSFVLWHRAPHRYWPPFTRCCPRLHKQAPRIVTTLERGFCSAPVRTGCFRRESYLDAGTTAVEITSDWSKLWWTPVFTRGSMCGTRS